MINFFDLNEEDFIVYNPYDLNETLNRLKNLTLDDVKDDLKNFQKKQFEFRYYEDEMNFSIDSIKFLTSQKKDINSKNDKNPENFETEEEFILLNKELNDELIDIKNINENDEDNKIKSNIKLSIASKDGNKTINIKCIVDPDKLAENIKKEFIDKSPFAKAKEIYDKYENNLQNLKNNCELDIKIQSNSINRIFYSKDIKTYVFDLQFPPLFRTNFLLNKEEKEESYNNFENNNNNYQKYENIVFPFRNFDDEIVNLKYRHFYIMIEKNNSSMEQTPGGPLPENDIDNIIYDNDTKEELLKSLENLFKKRNGDLSNEKFIQKDIKLKSEKEIKKDFRQPKYELSNYFNYLEKDKNLKQYFKELKFLKKNKNSNEEVSDEKYSDDEILKLYYQILALISENIISYYNAIKFTENLIYTDKNIENGKDYRNEIFSQCMDEEYPTFLNLTLTKILDKYQNSLKEFSLNEFENELKTMFETLYAKYESEDNDLQKLLIPSQNEKLHQIQRCIITPTYILFTPYVLDQGNRVIRTFTKINHAMLCGLKMDNFEEGRWNNVFLMEYIKFILKKGINLSAKTFKFFNYSQSQFRNFSCWLLTNPEKILPKTGNYNNIKIISKYGARISQTLTTTIPTISIPKENIIAIEDKLFYNEDDEVEYNFSDGIGKISYDLAEKISNFLKLDNVPSCFQGRFLGCKGVWTTIWDDNNGNIYYRPSQKKFDVKIGDNNIFELCDYSRYIQPYLNRQVILLLDALGVNKKKMYAKKNNNIFMKKLENYKNKLEEEKFVLDLIYYSEWNEMFHIMNSCGITRSNDRLMKSLIESNLEILFNDVKNKARIYIEEAAYAIGIMDEYNILEEGEAFLHIKKRDFEIVLNKKAAIAKCPCLHPGDIRVLEFKKYIPGKEETFKYKIFEKYENVLIFPSKGKRPHPNECSGSDLDGDNYFVFYDPDLIPEKTDPPMSYNFNVEAKTKDNITIDDIIEFFAEYINMNNLGQIGDAHLAHSDYEKDGARSKISMQIAEKFARAVDAPKTGDYVKLKKDEEPLKFPHYMGKQKNKTYTSTSVIGQLYDRTNEIILQNANKSGIALKFYDENLEIKGWKKFAILALEFYRDYYIEINSILKKNEIKGESVLLTGNNIDNDSSVFNKKKHNYDLREKVQDEMHELFIKSKKNFGNALNTIFNNEIIFGGIEQEIFFKNNLNLFSSACYMICYNLLEDVINKNKSIENFANEFSNNIDENLTKENDVENFNELAEYESEKYGVDFYEMQENIYEEYYVQIYDKKRFIKGIIDKKKKDMEKFVMQLKKDKIPRQPNEENHSRILSFAWCFAGRILSDIKFLNNF